MKLVDIPYYQCEKCNKLLKRLDNMEKHEAECAEAPVDVNQTNLFTEEETCQYLSKSMSQAQL